MVITFSGLDGSGKSTQIAKLAEWLRMRGIDHRIVETHGGTLYATVGRFIKRCSPSRSQSLLNEHYDLHRNSWRRRFLGRLRSVFFWLDVGIFSVWVKLLLDRRNRVIICDRSLVDEAVQLAYLGFCCVKGFTRRLKVCPSVTQAFFLSVPPEMAYARNPEYPIEHFRKKESFYELCRQTSALVAIPPGTPEDVHECIIGHVMALIEKGSDDPCCVSFHEPPAQ